MSGEDEVAVSAAPPQTEEEALRLKALAEQKYTSGDLNSAIRYAKLAHSIRPSLEGLQEILSAFGILCTASKPTLPSDSGGPNSPLDYYEILQVERFSHIDAIRKQYKKLALTLHPDKNPLAASEEAFKLVGEAFEVLSDRIKRKEYDTRLRIDMQAKAAEEVGLGAAEKFWTACSTCRLSHKFERKYLGHNLMCPRCKKSFEAVEVEEEEKDDEGLGKNVEVVEKRASSRIRERVAKGDNLVVGEKFGLDLNMKVSGKRKVLEKPEPKTNGDDDEILLKDLMFRHMGDDDDILLKDLKPRKGRDDEVLLKDLMPPSKGDRDILLKDLMPNRVNKKSETRNELENGNGIILYSRRSNGKLRNVDGDAKEKAVKRVVDKMVESDRAKRAKDREEENMPLFQMQILVKKRKLPDGISITKAREVDVVKLETEENEDGNVKEDGKEEETGKIGEETESEELIRDEIGNETEEEEEDEQEGEDKEVEMVNLAKHSVLPLDIERDPSPMGKGVEPNGTGKEKEKQMEGTRERRQRHRVSKYGYPNANGKTPKCHEDEDLDIVMPRLRNKISSEVILIEDSEFHDFSKDRSERSFKKGQVWAVYDKDDGIPRHYALIHEMVSLNPFEIKLHRLQLQTNGDAETINGQRLTFPVSCGIFKVSSEVSTAYLNLFSHVADCERAAREVYRIYPKKGSVWALYSSSNGNPEAEGSSNLMGKYPQSRDIVVILSTYSDLHGVSLGYLEKINGFKTVFKRQEIGAKAVICLGKNDLNLFSHQIPAKKLTGEESRELPKEDCWELDPQLLKGS